MLPTHYRLVVPELDEIHFPVEVLSTCADCAMRAHPGSGPNRVVFTAPAACCTYHPRLANFLVGRALERGDRGSERILLRMRDPEGIGPQGIAPPDAVARHYAEKATVEFGRNEALTCPFWVDGDLSCSIHAERPATCRTWYCKSLSGGKGRRARLLLKRVLQSVDDTLMHLCVAEGHPPDDGSATPEDWADWYRWCAAHVAGLDDTSIAALRGEALEKMLAQVRDSVEERDAPLPEILIPTVHSWVVEDDGVSMSGYSPYDLVDLPAWVFTLLSKLDGERTWRQAQRATFADVAQWPPDDLILTLFRRGIIGPPIPFDPELVNPKISFVPGE